MVELSLGASYVILGISAKANGLLHNILFLLAMVLGSIVLLSFAVTRIFKLLLPHIHSRI